MHLVHSKKEWKEHAKQTNEMITQRAKDRSGSGARKPKLQGAEGVHDADTVQKPQPETAQTSIEVFLLWLGDRAGVPLGEDMPMYVSGSSVVTVTPKRDPCTGLPIAAPAIGP